MENGSSSYTRFLCGNESAFEEIMEEYKDGLAAFINRYVRDAEAAEDIAIDVFTYVLINPGKYNFKTSLKTYLYMLGRSRALDYVRRRKRRQRSPAAVPAHRLWPSRGHRPPHPPLPVPCLKAS